MDPRLRDKNEYNYGEQDGTRKANEPGVYYHPKANKFVETGGTKLPNGQVAYNTANGKIQADAFRQMEYQPATPEQAAYYHAGQEAAAKVAKIKQSRTTTVMSMPGRR